MVANISVASWRVVPCPGEAKLSLPGLDFAGAKGTMSFNGLTGYGCGEAGPDAKRSTAARSRIMKIPLICSNLASCWFAERPNDYPGGQAGQENGGEESVVLQDARSAPRSG